MPDLSEFLTTRRDAKKLGCNVRSIPHMLKNGTLRSIRVGPIWLVTSRSVKEYRRRARGLSKNDPLRRGVHHPNRNIRGKR
jgi:hypothetical protein